MSARPLLFVHIPKAAGTTFSAVLRGHYPDREFDGGINVFRRLDAAGPRLAAAAASNRVRAVSAEVTFGLAALSLPEARYVTILRDPVERTLSQIWYLKSGHGAGQIAPGVRLPTRDLTIDEAIGGGYVLDNLQTRMLCGIVSPFDSLPPDALERAKRNLEERFAHVGTAERFDEFLALLSLELGWPTVPYERKRVNAERPDRSRVATTDLRRLDEANVLDRELYDHARDLLDRALDSAGPALEQELEILRRALPLERLARTGKAVDADTIRSLPVEARVVLALKQAELGQARTLLRRRKKRIQRLSAKLLEDQPVGDRDADPATR